MSSLRILLAEDNAVNQKVVLRMLEKLGYTADVAQNGEEAASLARNAPYDVIFMDLMMPRMDGFEATGVIRHAENGSHRSHIIALTANAMGADRSRCMEAGMDDFMTKPFMLETLKQKLASVEANADGPSQPAAATSAESVIDRSVLRSLAVMMDDDDTAYVKELLSDYLADAERLRGEIYRSVTEGDAETLRRASHTLKSNSATFGAVELADLCADIEQHAVKNEIDAVRDLLTVFENRLAAFHSALVDTVETNTY